MANTQTPPAVDITTNHKPSGGLYLTGSQDNIQTIAPEKVLLATVSPDFADGIEDTANNRITPGVAGWYWVIAQLVMNSTVADSVYSAMIKKSGTEVKTGPAQASKVGQVTILLMGLLKFSITDYVELWVDNRGGAGTEDVAGTDKYTYLVVQRIR